MLGLNRAWSTPHLNIHSISGESQWEKLDTKGDFPGCLQEHTMVGYANTIYVFGGEVGFSNGVETPLWMYDITVSRNCISYITAGFIDQSFRFKV